MIKRLVVCLSLLSFFLVGGVIKSGAKTVTTAGTQERLVATHTPAVFVDIMCKSSNTNPCFVGGSDIDSSTGIRLVPGGSYRIGSPDYRNRVDLYGIWVDVTTNGEGFTFTYMQKEDEL